MDHLAIACHGVTSVENTHQHLAGVEDTTTINAVRSIEAVSNLVRRMVRECEEALLTNKESHPAKVQILEDYLETLKAIINHNAAHTSRSSLQRRLSLLYP